MENQKSKIKHQTFWLLLLLAGPLVTALAVCPEQEFGPLTGLDEGRIATDPETGRPAVLGRVYAYTGEPIRIAGRVCDRDNGDPNYPPQALRVWREPGGAVLATDPNGNYEFTVQYPETGWHYETIALTDGIALRLGTVAVFTRTNRPPSLSCGGLSQ